MKSIEERLKEKKKKAVEKERKREDRDHRKQMEDSKKQVFVPNRNPSKEVMEIYPVDLKIK